jgi:hypothetical protein
LREKNAGIFLDLLQALSFSLEFHYSCSFSAKQQQQGPEFGAGCLPQSDFLFTETLLTTPQASYFN